MHCVYDVPPRLKPKNCLILSVLSGLGNTLSESLIVFWSANAIISSNEAKPLEKHVCVLVQEEAEYAIWREHSLDHRWWQRHRTSVGGGATAAWQRSSFTVRSEERLYGAITVNTGMKCITLNATDPQKVEHCARVLVITYPSQNVSINKGVVA